MTDRAGGCLRAEIRGLTLIELMVVVAVLAILATIAIPTYERYMQSVRRADGKAAAVAVALAEERFFSVYGKYSVTPTSLVTQAGLSAELGGGSSEKGYYDWSVLLAKDASGADCPGACFTVTVTPDKDKQQKGDTACTEMKLDSFGVKTEKPKDTDGGRCRWVGG